MTAKKAAAKRATTAVARKDDPPKPKELVRMYSPSFAAVLPSHITRPETWIRIAQGALKRGKRNKDGRTDLEVAAANDPGVFLSALLDAARLGLEPGTDEFYLIPRRTRGRLLVQGITGYQGYIELMYRSGAVASVVAEVVHEADHFEYQPGHHVVPLHKIDWDASDRGALRLVYAYARMVGGATSRVVVLNRSDIARIKESSDGADSEYSPWRNHEAAMWLKSAVRQLRKWVPTSAEYLTVRTAEPERAEISKSTPDDIDLVPGDTFDDSDVVDAEVIGEDTPTDSDGKDPGRPFTDDEEGGGDA